MSFPTNTSSSTPTSVAQTPSLARQKAPIAAAGATKFVRSRQKDVAALWPSILKIVVSLAGFAFTIAAVAWAVKSYNAASLANELSQKESCRAHPVCT